MTHDRPDNPMPVSQPDALERMTTTNPARLQRLGNIITNHLGAVGVDVEIRSLEDGRIAVVMPPEWASLFVANLEQQAITFKEKLQGAALEQRRREAELKAQSEQAQRESGERDRATYHLYKQYRNEGCTHRQALVKLRDRDHFWTLTLLNDVIRAQKAQDSLEQWQGVVARVRQHRLNGMSLPRIAMKERLTLAQVRHALSNDPYKRASQGTKAEWEQRRERIITLARQDFKPAAIATALDLPVEQVAAVVRRWQRGNPHTERSR